MADRTSAQAKIGVGDAFHKVCRSLADASRPPICGVTRFRPAIYLEAPQVWSNCDKSEYLQTQYCRRFDDYGDCCIRFRC